VEAAGASQHPDSGQGPPDIRRPTPSLSGDAPMPKASQENAAAELAGPKLVKQTPQSIGASNAAKPSPANQTSGDSAPEQIRRSLPAWLVSLGFHLFLLVALGLMYIAQKSESVLTIESIFSERLGDQTEIDSFDLATSEDVENSELVVTPDNLPVVDDPFVSPPDITQMLHGNRSTSNLPVPNIGLALDGRQEGMKKALLAVYGGTELTEAAVARALEWFVRVQRRDGLWILSDKRKNQKIDEEYDNPTAATAMALLAFQGAGHTPDEKGPYHAAVSKGWVALLKRQEASGRFRCNNVNHQLYSHAQATIALCELYGMTKKAEYREPAERAIAYAVRIQAKEGGWRYVPERDSDMSVTGWFAMAFQSARMAGLDVPKSTLLGITQFLDAVASYDGSEFRYRVAKTSQTSMALTAEGLLCRQYLGWTHGDRRLKLGVSKISADPIRWVPNEMDSYYWYYATQVLHHMGGDDWDRWNLVMRDVIPAHQVQQGPNRGSWYDDGDNWARNAGRLYMTSMCVYMLEVYYRHLPIYESLYDE